MKSKKTLIKIAIMMIFALLIAIFAGIAWFTMNKEVSTGGMSIKTVGDLFTIEPLGSPAHVGIYDDETKSGTYVRDKLISEAGKDSSIITWTITDDVAVTDPETNKTTVTKGLNIGNGPATGYEGGISPGSSGEIQFIIKPNQPMNAEFTFSVYAYSGGYDSNGDEDKSTIELIDSNSGADEILANTLINGHILLFKEKDSNGKYSGLIEVDPTDTLNRVMEKYYSGQTTVSIYWIWPETLAEVVLDENEPTQTRNLRGKSNICNSAGRAEIISLLKNNPDWFFLDPEDNDRDWSLIFDSTASDATIVNTINNSYGLYSSYYNEADQHIGTYVSYLFLNMSAAGAGTGSSGSGSGSGS